MAVDTMDEALAPFEIEGQLYKIALEEWGTTPAQASDFSKLYKSRFGLVSGIATHIETNFPAYHKEVQAFFAKETPHLLPPPFEVSLADQAFLENSLKARGQLVRELGEAGALELAKRYGHDSLISRATGTRPGNIEAPKKTPEVGTAGSHKNNPWHKSNFNITAQGRLLRAIGAEKCAAIAKSVGSHVGATHPNLNY